MQDVVKGDWILNIESSHPELNYLYEASSKDKVQN